jgi:hypothetical protein
MKVYKSYKFDKIHEIITSDNIDAKLDHYAEIMMMLLEIKKLIDSMPDNDDGSESSDDDDDISIGSDDCSLESSDIRLVEVDTDSDEE